MVKILFHYGESDNYRHDGGVIIYYIYGSCLLHLWLSLHVRGHLRHLQLHQSPQNFAFASNYLPPLEDDKSDVWRVNLFYPFSPQWTGFSQNFS